MKTEFCPMQFRAHYLFLVLFMALVACSQDSSLKSQPGKSILNETQAIELVFPNNSSESVKHAIIWLHGLGATANDFPPIVPHLGLDPSRAIRFIFPQAPDRPITINGGYVMPGWYDIRGLDLSSKEDREGIEQSRAMVEQLISKQIELGVPANNIILAGFSQGGAVSYYTTARSEHKLAGLLALSTYLVFMDQTESEQSKVNLNTPVFSSHGTQDSVVPLALGQQSVEYLQDLGYSVAWQTYPMAHEVSLPQIKAIGEWINQIFANK